MTKRKRKYYGWKSRCSEDLNKKYRVLSAIINVGEPTEEDFMLYEEIGNELIRRGFNPGYDWKPKIKPSRPSPSEDMI